MRDRCRRGAPSGLGDGKAGARTSSNDGRSQEQEQEEASGRFEARPVTKRTAAPFECVTSTAASGEFRHGRRNDIGRTCGARCAETPEACQSVATQGPVEAR